MKCTTLLFFLMVSSSLCAQNGAYLEDFQAKWKNAAAYSMEVAEAMPEGDYDYQPSPEVRTFEQQMIHSIKNMIWLSSTYMTDKKFEGDLDKAEYNKAEVVALLKDAFAFTTEAVVQLQPHDLNMTVKFFAGPKHLRQILTLMNDHLTHHRGQAIIYLRMKGVEPPKYRGW